MDENFARSKEFTAEEAKMPSTIHVHGKLINYLKNIDLSGNILDIGENNPLKRKIETRFRIKIDSTEGDLDEGLICPDKKYDLIIFSHVIEHLFNPLLCLENIKKVMKDDMILIIATTIKPNFMRWGTGHFHEMNNYRFKKLMERAGLKIIDWQKFRVRGDFKLRPGIRPMIQLFLRLIYRRSSIVVLQKNSDG